MSIVLAAILSIIYQVVLGGVCLLRGLPECRLWELWLFVLLNGLAIFELTIPLVAILREELKWYDPLGWLFVLFLTANVVFPLVFALDPGFVKVFMGYDSTFFQNSTAQEVLVRLCESRLVLVVFLTAVLASNWRSRPFQALRRAGTPRSRTVDLVVTLVCIVLGVGGFLLTWPGGAFAQKVVYDMGSSLTSTLFSSHPRFLFLINIGIAALPFGLAAWLGPSVEKRRVRGVRLVIVVAVIIGSALPHLALGSRITVVFTIVSGFMILGSLGVRIAPTGAALALAAAAVLVGVITLVRGNADVQQEGLYALRDVSALGAGLAERRGSGLGVLLDADRTAAVALVVEATGSGSEFVRGESLVAGPGNLAYAIWHRLSTGKGIEASDRPFLEANETIQLWRVGRIREGSAVPPSYPGEFYVQGGYVILGMLSVAFGLGFRYLRNRAAQSKGLFSRFIWITVALAVATYSQAETSMVTPVLVFTVLPIVAIHWGVGLLFSERLTRSWSRPGVAALRRGGGG
jgi:hypothetical protein